VSTSMGHVRDLPQQRQRDSGGLKARVGQPRRQTQPKDFGTALCGCRKDKKRLQGAQGRSQGAERVLLPQTKTEGRGISWHLLQLLSPKVPVKAVWSFHEITKEADWPGLDQTANSTWSSSIARDPADPGSAGGLHLSPTALEEVAWGLSAGGCNSVAVRLLVQRERARRAFAKRMLLDLQGPAPQRHGGFEAQS